MRPLPTHPLLSSAQHLVETILPVGAALVVAIFVTDVGIVFSFIGSVTATYISFIMPGYIFLQSPSLKDRSPLDVAAGWAIVAFGILVALAGFICAVIGSTE